MMDKIVMIAAVVAIIAIVGVGFMMNPGSSTPATTQEQPASQSGNDNQGASQGSGTNSNGNTDDNTSNPADNHLPVPDDRSNYTNAQFGVMVPDIQGDCTLYKHVTKTEFKCFGTAGNFSTLATNEYRTFSNQTEYFCKPTQYGCKLYQKVTFQQ